MYFGKRFLKKHTLTLKTYRLNINSCKISVLIIYALKIHKAKNKYLEIIR